MLVLIGFMGAGKSTVGRLLAAELGVPFVDSDAAVEARTGRRVADIFASLGEPAFRAVERETIAHLLADPPAVLALGGGAVEDARTRETLREHTVVYLQVDLDEVRTRVGADGLRPVLAHPDLKVRYANRLPQYVDAAQVSIATRGRTPDEVVKEILACVSV